MKRFFIKILAWKLKKLAQFTIKKYRPGVIGITGSVGKTSAKAAITAVLSSERRVRASSRNFNNELGLPLAVLGSWDKIDGAMFWPRVFVVGLLQLIRNAEYPEILVLEYGVDRPGDMKKLLDIVEPNISVITAVGDVPVHVEFFSGPDELVREKGRIIEHLPVAGFAVLNADDEAVADLKNRTHAHTITFGFNRGTEMRITNYENHADGNRPSGISFKIGYGGSFAPVKLYGAFGKAQAYAAAAASAIGTIFGMNLIKISEALKNYRPVAGRMQLIPGVKYTHILDGSYNASPLSMEAALETLKELPGKRKIAVLGDMTEIGKYTVEAHEHIGLLAAKVADVLVTVGPRAKFMADSARKHGLNKRNIYMFDTADWAARPVQDLIKKGDLILIKASHAMQFEKIVEEIKAF